MARDRQLARRLLRHRRRRAARLPRRAPQPGGRPGARPGRRRSARRRRGTATSRFVFRAEYVDELRALAPPAPLTDPERYFAVIAKGDEVLSWREMSARYAGCQVRSCRRQRPRAERLRRPPAATCSPSSASTRADAGGSHFQVAMVWTTRPQTSTLNQASARARSRRRRRLASRSSARALAVEGDRDAAKLGQRADARASAAMHAGDTSAGRVTDHRAATSAMPRAGEPGAAAQPARDSPRRRQLREARPAPAPRPRR